MLVKYIEERQGPSWFTSISIAKGDLGVDGFLAAEVSKCGCHEKHRPYTSHFTVPMYVGILSESLFFGSAIEFRCHFGKILQ
jgi:hypothetical protein